jgi:hypothetical protein
MTAAPCVPSLDTAPRGDRLVCLGAGICVSLAASAAVSAPVVYSNGSSLGSSSSEKRSRLGVGRDLVLLVPDDGGSLAPGSILRLFAPVFASFVAPAGVVGWGGLLRVTRRVIIGATGAPSITGDPKSTSCTSCLLKVDC